MEDFKSTPAIRNTNLEQLVTPILNQTQVWGKGLWITYTEENLFETESGVPFSINEIEKLLNTKRYT